MRMPKRGEKGFTLIELLIVVAILGVLAAVIIPNVSRFFGSGEEEARNTERSNVQLAVDTMMLDNGISILPTNTDWPESGGAATQDMKVFPDDTSAAGTVDEKLTDPDGFTYVTVLDADGYVLFGHDITGQTNPESTNVNYMREDTTTYFYTVDNDGTVHQYSSITKGGF